MLNFFIVPKYFFVPQIIEKRKPLANNARRAGWIGCNIIIDNVPQAGKIFYIKDKVVVPQTEVIKNWQKTVFLREELKTTKRSWLLDIMNCIDKLGEKEFSLSDVYEFEIELQTKHPRNLHIKDKIRQQLQILRDRNYLEFLGRGKYRLL